MPSLAAGALKLALGSVSPSVDLNNDGDLDDAGETKNVYHMRVTGHNWGTASATCDLALSDANGIAFTSIASGLSRHQAAPTSATPTSIRFGTEFGSNPGFWIDDVSSHNAPTGPPPAISYFVAGGNTLTWKRSGATTHSPAPSITFGTIITNPTGGDQDEESIELPNPKSFAVDLSNWQLTGRVTHAMRPGTVIPTNGFLVLSPDLELYRSLNAPRFTQGNYSGHISSFSETLTLTNVAGTSIATVITPDTSSDNQLYLHISEIMYNPAGDNEEFIELVNTSDSITLTLDGVMFTEGFEFTFPASTTLSPGQRIVVTETDFISGGLSNGGETIKLDDSDSATIQEFTYDDKSPWPSSTDGSGPSLVFRSGDPDLPESWRASLANGGTPGTSDSVPYTNGDIHAYALSETLQFDTDTNILTIPRNPGADDISSTPQWSSDLQNWVPENFTYQGSDQ